MVEEVESPWDSFIERSLIDDRTMSSYDLLIELAVSTYHLGRRSREMGLKDRCQFLFKYWHKHQSKMKYYTSLEKIGKLCGLDHSSVHHSIYDRKPTINYKENTACLKDFLES